MGHEIVRVGACGIRSDFSGDVIRPIIHCFEAGKSFVNKGRIASGDTITCPYCGEKLVLDIEVKYRLLPERRVSRKWRGIFLPQGLALDG